MINKKGFPMFILASASPRRADLLRSVGYAQFIVEPVEIDESPRKKELPALFAERMAREKLEAAVARFPDRVVLTADTVVAKGRTVVDKARSSEEVRRCLAFLSGGSHRVYTAVRCYDPKERRAGSRLSETRIKFKTLTQEEIDAYAASGEGVGKAGGYAVQGRAARFVLRLSGSFTGVVGLPLYEACNLLEGCGARPG
jgi:septum formation protein